MTNKDNGGTAFAWWCEENDCITRSYHIRDHWIANGKTVVPLYK